MFTVKDRTRNMSRINVLCQFYTNADSKKNFYIKDFMISSDLNLNLTKTDI